MAMAIFSPYKTNEGGVTYPRDASFSSYLDTTERDFVRSLAESINSAPSHAREIFTPRKSVGRSNSQSRRSGELDVFGADRYFNEKIKNSPFPRKGGGEGSTHYHRDFRRVKGDDFLERKPSRSNINSTSSSSLKSPTPSLKSGGSFNSQIGLLLPKKGFIGHKIFSSFQCKGSCFDKKSVSTTNTHHMVQSSSKSYKENDNGHTKNRLSHQQHFAFPIINTESFSLDHHHHHQSSKSMDAFGFHQLQNQEITQNLDIKNPWNAIQNSTISTTPLPFPLRKQTSHYNVRDEDECSDTSSDLFEIETLTGVPCIQTSTNSYYEPSEESIEWSVVTASPADNFSDLPDHHEDDHKTTITIERRKVQKSSTSGGMYLGCTNHKAVDVVGNHYNNQP